MNTAELGNYNEGEQEITQKRKSPNLIGLTVAAYGDGIDTTRSERDRAREALREMGIDTSEVEKNLPLDRPLLCDIIDNFKKQLAAKGENNEE